MLRKMHLTLENIFIFLLAIYPVVSLNYYIGIFNYPSFLSMVIVVLYLIINGNYKVKKAMKYSPLFWVNILYVSLHMFIMSSPIKGISYFVQIFMVCFVTFQFLTKDTSRFSKLIDMLIRISFVLALLAFVESLTKSYIFQNELLGNDPLRYGMLRVTTTFAQPINFSIYQAIIALLLFYKLQFKGLNNREKRLKWIMYFSIVISVFLTISRLGICLYLGGQLIMILKQGVNKTLKVFLLIILGLVIIYLLSNLLGISFLYSVFSDMLAMINSLLFGKEVSSGTISYGNRLDLYNWVLNDVGKNEMWFGKGIQATFAYKVTDWFTKESIEVNYLNIYYHYGLIGLIIYLLSYVSNIVFLIKNKSTCFFEENKINFINLMLIILILYFFVMFGIQETDITRIYSMLITMCFCYKYYSIRKIKLKSF